MIELNETELALWGKKAMQDNQELWLPLITHLIDTKNVANWLYNHWLSDNQRAVLLIDDSEEKTQNLVNFLGYIHDLGKATPAFQKKVSYSQSRSLDQDILESLIRAGFTGLDDLQLSFPNKSPHNLAGEAILEHFGLNNSVAAIIGGHHGTQENNLPKDQLRSYRNNLWQAVYDADAQQRWQTVQKDLIDYGLAICNFNSLNDIPVVTQPQAVLLEGLLIMADWLASSEYLKINKGENRLPLFPLINLDESATDLDMEVRFRNAMSNWNQFDFWHSNGVSDIDEHYQKRWNFKPRPVQKKMSEVIGKMVDPGMIIIEAPMGIGKTEIALTATEQLAERCGCNGLFMGLPTQATANAMFSRVKKWLDSISKEQQLNLSVKLIHGKARFNKEYTSIPEASNVNAEASSGKDENAGAVVVNSWFSGKKSILEEFAIGTIDNLLQMGLIQRYLFLKHLGFSGKVVVIDEVHSYDIYMSSYLDKALEWLGVYHVPVVVLSATLPKQRRNQLLKAYARGKFGRSCFVAPDGWENNQAYPLLSALDGQSLIQVSDFAPQPTKQVKIQRINLDDQTTIEAVLDKIKNGGVAGVVVNTVKRAQALAKLVPSDVQTILLHSAFLAPDRAKIETQLQKAIGKDGERPEKLIIIGTQVLEQSLDIDFDILFTDIAPMDLILQRIGRLHRHSVKRPAILTNPQVFVMGINDYGNYGKANEAVYQRYLLMKTDHFLPDIINLPDDISDLVQKVYDSATDSEVNNLTDAKKKFAEYQELLNEKANKFQIKLPRKNKTLHRWLDWNKLSGSETQANEINAQAAVRDIRETLEVILVKKDDVGYCLLDGRSLNDVPSETVAQQTINLPASVTQDIGKAINDLETITMKHFPQWHNSPWLRGSLALILDKDSTTEFRGFNLRYSSTEGLVYEKEQEESE